MHVLLLVCSVAGAAHAFATWSVTGDEWPLRAGVTWIIVALGALVGARRAKFLAEVLRDLEEVRDVLRGAPTAVRTGVAPTGWGKADEDPVYVASHRLLDALERLPGLPLGPGGEGVEAWAAAEALRAALGRK